MKKVAGFLLLLTLLAAGVFLVSWLTTLNSPRTISALLGTGIGLSEGQIVEIVGVGEAGAIRSIDPVSDGVIVTIELHGASPLGKGTIIVFRPSAPPIPSRLEIVPPAGAAEPLTFPSRVNGRIEVGPPDGLAEPSPIWPGGGS